MTSPKTTSYTRPTPPHKSYGVAISVLILLAGSIAGWFAYKYLSTTNQEIEKQQEALQKVAATKTTLMAFQSAWQKNPEHPVFSTLPRLVGSTDDTSSLITSFEHLAQTTGLILTSYAASLGVKEHANLTIPLQVTFTGQISYPLLKTLLKQISILLPLVDVVSFSFNPSETTLALSLKTYATLVPDILFPSKDILNYPALNNPLVKSIPPVPVASPPLETKGNPDPFAR